jgi:uncharacterized SAM-binding protein YcdF (DUF218 family)
MLPLILLAALGGWGFSNVGRWLVIADPLQQARAIVVLSGGAPFRAMGAADLYRQGWAKEVWITTGYDRRAAKAFAQLGVPYIPDSEYSERVLEKLDVPYEAIHVLPDLIHNTEEEVRVIAAKLRETGGNNVIIVTSPPHTRRVKTIWRIKVGDGKQAIVRYDAYESYDPAHWWRSTSQGDDVVHEVLGLLNARMGFLARPNE